MSQRTLHSPLFSKPAALLLATFLIATAARAQENPGTEPPTESADSTAQPASTRTPTLPNPPGLIRRAQPAGESSSNPQSPNSNPTALQPPPRKPDYGPFSGAYGFLYRGSLACGAGAAYSEPEKKPAVGCGFGFTLFPMLVNEFGLMAPALNRRNFTIYWSEDATIPLRMPISFVRATNGHPIVLAGYTRMFETGRNAFDYGIGFERHADEYHSLQFELRDYWTFATPDQHNVMLRIVWVTGLPD